MKKTMSILLVITLILSVFVPVGAFARNYNYCPFTGNSHDFTACVKRLSDRHPHGSAFICPCGEEIRFDLHYSAYCSTCKKKLCREGLHNYMYDVWGDEEHLYGECYCGRTLEFSHGRKERKHYIHEEEGFVDGCDICEYKSDYREQVYEYNVQTIYYQSEYQYYKDDYRYYEDEYEYYEDEYEYYEDENDYYYEEDVEEYYEEEEEDFTISFSSSVSSSLSVDTGNNQYYYEEHYESTGPNSVDVTISHSYSETINNNCYEEPVYYPEENYSNNNNYSNSSQNEANSEPEFVHEDYIIVDRSYVQDDYMNVPLAKNTTVDFATAIDQTLLGNYSNNVTVPGTIGEFALALLGLDPWKDYTDLVYDVTHWENSLDHYTTTVLDLAAFLPIIGASKTTDDVALIRKTSQNYTALKKILKSIDIKDVRKLLNYSDGHALTKHVGNTSQAVLKALRNGSKNISSFYDEATALECVRAALKNENNISLIANNISKGKNKFAIEHSMGKAIGTGIFGSADMVEHVQRVRVIIQPLDDGGFYVKTAFPIR
ncbi:MAG: hypothetical protein E7311_07370 [Clostridiales bacterium]|nr:hypothetical protein [Clostridiales bacterium]